MLLNTKPWRLISVILCISLLSGCIAKSQQKSQPLISVKPVLEQVANNQLAPAPRGLHTDKYDPSVIIPGQSVGPLRLGDTRERALQVFGEPTEEYTYDDQSLGPCEYTEMHWNDLDHEDRWGIFVYLKDNRIYQISADTPRYTTTNNITSDSSPEEVRHNFLHLQSYVLLHSAGEVNGGKDLIYWVNEHDGIAFEFYHHPKLNRRRVASIIIFEPNNKFLPRGCIAPPQEWRQLNGYVAKID